MDSVKPAQCAALGEVSGSLRNLRGKLDQHETCQITIERGDGASESGSSDGCLALAARERGPRLGIRHTGGCDHRSGVEPCPCLLRPSFAHVDLHECARIEIEDQRRSSTPACETDGPRTRAAFSRPTGLPPDHASRPLFTRVRTTVSASSVALAGTMIATGRFRSVTVIASPRRTRASVALNLSLSSRTPICVFAMTPPLGLSGHIIRQCGYQSMSPAPRCGRTTRRGGGRNVESEARRPDSVPRRLYGALHSGGGGNRTPVRRCIHDRVYVRSLRF